MFNGKKIKQGTKIKGVNQISNDTDCDTMFIFNHICQCLKVFSNSLHRLRLLKEFEKCCLGKLKHKCGKDPSQKQT